MLVTEPPASKNSCVCRCWFFLAWKEEISEVCYLMERKLMVRLDNIRISMCLLFEACDIGHESVCLTFRLSCIAADSCGHDLAGTPEGHGC